ncbi:TetR/AcrR family transcriptional regulator [Aquabacterium sp.]|uniref:TetR/AcrR family transcriptional regulator n=1 Tax=Aquabacterium sp. TaxID=1872578 RepID=UPI0025BA6084|nr:TetR/AcrR family transcriptional regulator [Aquabacterium sp.]
MPRTADKTDIPRRLAEAGYTLFARHGYNATGIQQITDAAGVPKGSFYNHFESKEAFAAQIIHHYAAWMDKRWQAHLADAPAAPLDTIRHLFQRFIAQHEQAACPGCLVGNFAGEVSESSEACRLAMADVMAQWRERLAGLITLAQASGSVRTDMPAAQLASFFWDTWEGAVLRMKVEHSSQPLHEALGLMLDRFFRPD